MFLLLGTILAATPSLEPTGKWNLAAEHTYCLLSHNFKTSDGEVTLAFKPYEGGKTFGLVLISPAAKSKTSDGTAKLTFETYTPTTARYMSIVRTSQNQLVTESRPQTGLISVIAGEAKLTVEAGSGSWAFRLPPGGKAFAALSECQAALIKTWAEDADTGVTPALIEAKPRTAAKLEPGRLTALFGDSKNYPPEARSARIEGGVETTLVLSSAGKVDQCVVVKAVAVSLGEGTCELARGIPFTPATDTDGKPVRSKFSLRVRWQLPS